METGAAVALIPARSGSTGVPDKNIRPLAGHPLLGWAIRSAVLASGIGRVVVSTDSARYADIARAYGAEVPFLRPADLSGDDIGDFPVVRHLLEQLSEEAAVPELLVHLRPTTPLRRPDVVDAAVAALRADPSATALRSVHPMPETAYKALELRERYLVTVFDGDGDIERANRPRQSYPSTWTANGYVDVLRSAVVLDRGMMHGDRAIGFETPRVPEVDTAEDFEILECLAGRHPELAAELFGDGAR